MIVAWWNRRHTNATRQRGGPVTHHQATPPLGWWTIPGEAILDMLHRAANGEHPDLIYAEAHANAEHEHPDE